MERSCLFSILRSLRIPFLERIRGILVFSCAVVLCADSRGRLRFIVCDGVEGNEGIFRLDGSFSAQSASMGPSVVVSLSEVVDSESVEDSWDPRMMGNECQL